MKSVLPCIKFHFCQVHAYSTSSKVIAEDKLGVVCVTDGDMAKIANL